jgi:DnaJ-class molecular chaperone
MDGQRCFKCNGSGEYHFGGATVNGVFQGQKGPCYACAGKGWQSPADVKRNAYYWNHVARLSNG